MGKPNISQMLPINRTSFKSVLHTSVGAAWYFHVIIVIIGHLILTGLAIYHYKIFKKSLSLSQSSYCNPFSIHQCPAKCSCLGTAMIAFLGVLRSSYYCIGPYAVSLKNPHFVFIGLVQVLEYVCYSFDLEVFTLLIFSQFLILVRAKSITVLTTPSSMDKKDYRFHRFPILIVISCVVTSLIFMAGLATLVLRSVQPILHLVTGLWFAILSFSAIYLTWIGRNHTTEPISNSFVFYSTSSSSSNPHLSPENEAIESRIYYECHSGLPRCMTKTSLNEFFVPHSLSDRSLSNSNSKQTFIHINDLEIVIEIEEPILNVSNALESEIIAESNEIKRGSLSTISSIKVTTIDGEHGGYVADSEDNVKNDNRDSIAISMEPHLPDALHLTERTEKSQKNETFIVKKGNCDDRINIRQMIVAEEYMRIFLSGLNFFRTSIVTGLLLSSINIYNGFGRFGTITNNINRSIVGWSIWLIILSFFR